MTWANARISLLGECLQSPLVALEQMLAHPMRVKPVPGKAVQRVEINKARSIQNGLGEVGTGLPVFVHHDVDFDEVVRSHHEVISAIDLVATGKLAGDFLEEV